MRGHFFGFDYARIAVMSGWMPNRRFRRRVLQLFAAGQASRLFPQHPANTP